MSAVNSFVNNHPISKLSQIDFVHIINDLKEFPQKKCAYIKIVQCNGIWVPQIYKCNWFESFLFLFWKPEALRVHNMAQWMFNFLDDNKDRLYHSDSTAVLNLAKRIHSLRKHHTPLDKFLDSVTGKARECLLQMAVIESLKILADAKKKAQEILNQAEAESKSKIQKSIDKGMEEYNKILHDAALDALKKMDTVNHLEANSDAAYQEILKTVNEEEKETKQLLVNANIKGDQIIEEANQKAILIMQNATEIEKEIQEKTAITKKELKFLQEKLNFYSNTLCIANNDAVIGLDKEFLEKIPFFKTAYNSQLGKNNPKEDFKKLYPNAKYVFYFPGISEHCLSVFRKYLFHGSKVLNEVEESSLVELGIFSNYLEFDAFEKDLTKLVQKKKCFDSIINQDVSNNKI